MKAAGRHGDREDRTVPGGWGQFFCIKATNKPLVKLNIINLKIPTTHFIGKEVLNLGRFSGRTYLVTGASSGIGKALGQRIAADGGRVVMIARDRQKLEKTMSEMPKSEDHLIIDYDLTDFEHYNEIFSRIKKEGVKLDGLVHCAGIADVLPLRIMNRNNALKLFDIHYFAFIELVKFYVKKGISDGGSIVGVSAMNVHTPQKCMTAYAAAKSAVESACKTLALELTEKGIRINSVIVGGVATNIAGNMSEVVAAVGSTYENPVQRQLLGTEKPEQIADVISFLLSDESSCITGRALYADAGLL